MKTCLLYEVRKFKTRTANFQNWIFNRFGMIDREFFLTYYVASAVVGFFIMLIVFINNTTDRTTFMFKIVSIGFLSFLLIFSLVSKIVMNEREATYDLLHQNQLKSIIQLESQPQDLRYIIIYNPHEDKYNYVFDAINSNLPEESFKYEVVYSYFLENIKDKNLSPMELAEYIRNLKVANRKYFTGYEESILQYIATLPNEEKNAGNLKSISGSSFILLER